MLAKIWKKLLLVILILACLVNVVFKLVHKLSLQQELAESAAYVAEQHELEKENK